MTTAVKDQFADPLSLLKSQKCSVEDVYGFLKDAVAESRAAREASDDQLVEFWSRVITRLHDQYEAMKLDRINSKARPFWSTGSR